MMGGLKVKNQLFVVLSKQLVRVMKKMDSHQRRIFMVGIIEDKIGVEEWCQPVKSVQEVESAVKELETQPNKPS